MRLRTWIEAVVILAAASVAFAGEWSNKSTQAVIDATQARNIAETLPVLTPWPVYEWLRLGAVADGRDATGRAAVGAIYGKAADNWFSTYQTARARGDDVGANAAAIAYQDAATSCDKQLRLSAEAARNSRAQSTQCLMMLRN